MTTAKTLLLQLYNPLMLESGQAAYGFLPAGQLSAAASFATSASTVVMAQTVPSWVVAGMNVYDVTKAANLGQFAAATSATLTLSADFSSASSGAADVLQFGFTPSDLSVGFADGVDINGMVEACQLHCAEAIYMLTYLKTDVITNSQDSANYTILNNAVTALS